MSYENTDNTGSGRREVYHSGGLNDTTGREPFEDSRDVSRSASGSGFTGIGGVETTAAGGNGSHNGNSVVEGLKERLGDFRDEFNIEQKEGRGLTSADVRNAGAVNTSDNTNYSSAYGQDLDNKRETNNNITRHGDDFTGSAYGNPAYTNEHARTGLTGRETTTSGVPDKDGNATSQHGGGLKAKINHALHKD